MIQTGYPLADAVLGPLIARLAEALPGHLAACYLEGSYADGTAVATSDIDLTIALRGAHSDCAHSASSNPVAAQRRAITRC